MEAVIYTRVSSDQSGGRSVEDQEKECRAYCERQGWTVRNVYSDNDIGASRWSKKDRPQWAKLKDDLRPGDVLVLWESSRATRDMGEYLVLRDLCESRGVTVSYSGRRLDFADGEDRFIGGLDALLSERESEKLRDRVLRGRRGSAARGRPGSRPPWGYRAVGVAQWEIDPVAGPRVKAAAERMLAGESQRSILAWLKSTGDAPARASGLRRALSNPAIAGLRVHQGQVIGKGAWEPIIAEEQHHRLAALVSSKATNLPGPDPKHLLSGIAVCGACGAPLEFKIGKGRPDAYRCPAGHVQRAAAKLDTIVEGELFRRLAKVNPSDYESDDDGAEEARAQIADIERQLGEYTDAAIAGTISAPAFVKIEAGLNARIAEIRPRTVGRSRLHALPVRQLEANWGSLRLADRRRIVRVLASVTVNPLGSRRRATDGDTVVTLI